MIYKTLDTIPIKIFLAICATNDTSLLIYSSTEPDQEIQPEELQALWENLEEAHSKLNPNKETSQILRISREISALYSKYKAICIACEALRFDIDDELIAMLKKFGYKLAFETYHEDLERIERESGALLIKIEKLKEQLPKTYDSESTNIDEVMASYSLILGYDFDYNTISVTKFYALQTQVSIKIKALKNNGK